MTLTTVSPGDGISVRVIKSFNTFKWANTYEFQYIDDQPLVDPAQLFQNVGSVLATRESALLLDLYRVERIVFSTVERDGVPYNPLTFVVLDFNLQGQRPIPIAQRPLPLTTCMLVKKRVDFGRQGNILYRGCLHTGDGSMDSEGFVLNNGRVTTVNLELNTMLDDLKNNYSLQMALITVNTANQITDARPVNELLVRPVTTIKKLNNKYFDKG